MIKGIAKVWEDYEGFFAVLAVIAFVIGYLAWMLGLMCLQAWLVMVLWNWVAVELFGAPVLTFWVAFGLRWLCALLFKTRVKVDKEK
jgi:hypothetical protein